jgi:FlaA1/EpsC-like NDP-sugar epimerase
MRVRFGWPDLAPQVLVIVAITVLVDLVTVTFSYAIARGVLSPHRTPDLADLARMSPVILATIPCWVAVFLAFGLYGHRYVVETKMPIMSRLLEAITVSVVLVIVVAFAANDDKLHRAWVLTLWVTALVLVSAGRFVLYRVSPLLSPR